MSDVQSMIDEKVRELNEKLYGPRFCQNCGVIREVQTFKLAGSDFTEGEGYTIKAGFTGAHVCTVCNHTIKDPHPSGEKGSRE